MDSVGEGEGEKIWENGIETCILSCMKQVASPGLMHDAGKDWRWEEKGVTEDEIVGWHH